MMMMMVTILWLSGLWQFCMLVGGNMIVIPVDAASSIMFYVSFNAQFSKMLTYPYSCSYYLPKYMYAHRTAIWICTCCGKSWGAFTMWMPWGHMSFLISKLPGGLWSVARPDCFVYGLRTPGMHWVWGWLRPRAPLASLGKRKISSSCKESNHNS